MILTELIFYCWKGFFYFNKCEKTYIKRGHGLSMREWMEKTNPSEIEFWSVLFQIFYTLECFNQIHLRHNDLHFDNIYIETQIQQQNFVYFTSPDTYFLIPIRNVVKLFDFDRAYSWNDAGKIKHLFF